EPVAGITGDGHPFDRSGRHLATDAPRHAHRLGRPALLTTGTIRSRHHRRGRNLANVLVRHPATVETGVDHSCDVHDHRRHEDVRQDLRHDTGRTGASYGDAFGVRLSEDLLLYGTRLWLRRHLRVRAFDDAPELAVHTLSAGAMRAPSGKDVVTPKRRRQLGNLAYVFAVLPLLAFSAFPFLWMLLQSLKSRGDVIAYPPKWIFVPTLEN